MVDRDGSLNIYFPSKSISLIFTFRFLFLLFFNFIFTQLFKFLLYIRNYYTRRVEGLNRAQLCGLLVQLNNSALMTLIARNEDISLSCRVINIDHTGAFPLRSLAKINGGRSLRLSLCSDGGGFSLARGYFRKEINTNK